MIRPIANMQFENNNSRSAHETRIHSFVLIRAIIPRMDRTVAGGGAFGQLPSNIFVPPLICLTSLKINVQN